MWDEVTFFNRDGTHSVDLLSTGYSIKELSWSYEYDGSEFPKQQDSGQAQAHSFVRRLTFNLVVQITGDSFSGYWTARQALADAFIIADGTQVEYRHGQIEVTPTGQPQIYADVNVTGVSFPTSVDEAKTSIATITMRADRGYWLKASDDSVIRI